MPKGYKSPLGINRWILLGWYAFVLASCSFLVGGVDPLKKLLWLNETAKTADNEREQLASIESIVNLGFCCSSLLSWFVAYWASMQQPRTTALWSFIFFGCGMLLLFIADLPAMNSIGIAIIAGTFNSTFNAHLTVASLFPSKSELVFDIFGPAPDLSTLVPLGLAFIVERQSTPRISADPGLFHVEPNSKLVGAIILNYLAFVLGIAIIDVVLLPAKSFDQALGPKFKAKMESLPKRAKKFSRRLANTKLFRKVVATFARQEDEDCVLADLTALQQFIHPLFWSTGLFFGFNLFRKYYVLSSFRYTVESYAGAEEINSQYVRILNDMMSVANAISSIPTTYLIRASSETGPFMSSMIIAISATLTTGCMIIPSVHAQWGTIFFFWIWSTLIYGNLFSVVSEYFGTRHVSKIQGSQMMIGGLCVLVYPTLLEIMDQPFLPKTGLSAAGKDSSAWISVSAQNFHLGVTVLGMLAILSPAYEAAITVPYLRRLRLQRDDKRASSVKLAVNQITESVQQNVLLGKQQAQRRISTQQHDPKILGSPEAQRGSITQNPQPTKPRPVVVKLQTRLPPEVLQAGRQSFAERFAESTQSAQPTEPVHVPRSDRRQSQGPQQISPVAIAEETNIDIVDVVDMSNDTVLDREISPSEVTPPAQIVNVEVTPPPTTDLDIEAINSALFTLIEHAHADGMGHEIQERVFDYVYDRIMQLPEDPDEVFEDLSSSSDGSHGSSTNTGGSADRKSDDFTIPSLSHSSAYGKRGGIPRLSIASAIDAHGRERGRFLTNAERRRTTTVVGRLSTGCMALNSSNFAQLVGASVAETLLDRRFAHRRRSSQNTYESSSSSTSDEEDQPFGDAREFDDMQSASSFRPDSARRSNGKSQQFTSPVVSSVNKPVGEDQLSPLSTVNEETEPLMGAQRISEPSLNSRAIGFAIFPKPEGYSE